MTGLATGDTADLVVRAQRAWADGAFRPAAVVVHDGRITGVLPVDAVVDASPHSGGSAEIVGSGGFAMAIVGGALLLSRPLRWVLLPVAALGSTTLDAETIEVTLGTVLKYREDQERARVHGLDKLLHRDASAHG